MADGFSTNLRFRKMEVGANQNAWGPLANEDFGSDRIEQAIVGIQAYTLSGSKTLTVSDGETDENRMRVQLITGGTGGTVNVNAGAQWHWFYAGSSGDVTVTNGSNSVVVKAGNGVPVVSDGTNIYQLRCIDYGSDLPKSTGTPTNGSDLVTKTYADGLAFSTSLPGQSGNSGKFLKTDGTNASWAAVSSANVTDALGYTPTSVTTLTGVQSVSAFKTGLSLGNVENKSSATIRAEFVAAANTYTAKQSFLASASGGAGVNLGQGAAPSSPVAGDVWETTSGIFYYDGSQTIGLGKWTQIGSPISTSGPSGFTISSIPAAFTDVMLVWQGVSTTTLSSVNITIDLSDNGTNWTTPITVVSGSAGADSLYGTTVLTGFRFGAGLLLSTIGTSAGNRSATASNIVNYSYRVDAGVSQIRIATGGTTFDAGTLTVFGR